MKQISRKQSKINRTLRDIKLKLAYESERCRLCGAKAVDLAHLLPRSLYPEHQTKEWNVTLLCRRCHVKFDKDKLPSLYNKLVIKLDDETEVALEVAQHVGHDVVRCISMESTDGLQRGMIANDTGAAIQVPVGDETLGRMFNVLGEPIDEIESISTI